MFTSIESFKYVLDQMSSALLNITTIFVNTKLTPFCIVGSCLNVNKKKQLTCFSFPFICQNKYLKHLEKQYLSVISFCTKRSINNGPTNHRF